MTRDSVDRNSDGTLKHSKVLYVPVVNGAVVTGFYVLAIDVTELHVSLERIRALAHKKCIKDLRYGADRLRFSGLSHLTLFDCVSSHAKEFGLSAGLEIQVIEGSSIRMLGESDKSLLFRAVQETLLNIRRHAGVVLVQIKISADSQSALELERPLTPHCSRRRLPFQTQS